MWYIFLLNFKNLCQIQQKKKQKTKKQQMPYLYLQAKCMKIVSTISTVFKLSNRAVDEALLFTLKKYFHLEIHNYRDNV